MKNLLWTKSYGLFKTHYNYDAQGRVTQSRTGNRVTHYSYDSRGNLASITDPLGKTTTYSYDSRDRVVQTTYPDGTTESFAYDANSNLVTRTVPTPADHSFGYNGVNKRISTTSPEQKQITYAYDKQRRVIKVMKPSAKSIETNYVNGRVESITTPEGTTNYAYACQSNVSSITQGSEKFTFTYDGTLVTSISQSGILNESISYTYNNDFLPASITYAGTTVPYSYNKDNELVLSGGLNISRVKNRGLDVTLSDGTYTQTSHYNLYSELSKQHDNAIALKLYRNKAGQILKKIETLNNNKTTYTYQYDPRGRLTAVRKNRKLAEKYTYDANGNRASATVNGTSITASYTLDDNLVVYGDNSYLYDEDGYLKTKTTPQGATNYSYGTRGELLAVTTTTSTGSVTVITYKHNALNQRVAKLVDGVIVEKYLWANLTTLLAVYDGSDNLIQRFEYADNRMPISMTDANGTKYYLHYDQVGSLRAISDTSHNIVKEITYDTYGNMLTDSNPSFTIPFGFAGGLYDADTKLTRFGYRDYDAYTGKWTAKDPIGFSGGDSNLYGYVLGDPVGGFDPDGLINRNGGHGHNRDGGSYHGPFGPLCGPEGKPLARWIPDITPYACIQHDDCYARCAKVCGGENCKEMCDYGLIDYNPIYGAATYWAGSSTYFPLEKECGCE